jgi:Collagen triple helix repeat (20 copies)
MHRLKEPFGKAGLIVAIVALVAATVGGAYAAKGGNPPASASKKKSKAKKGPRGPRGKTGPAGPAGPQGPAGSNGNDGSNGNNGSDGKEGKQGPQGDPGSQGPEGSPWTAGGTLPSDETETGTWVLPEATEPALVRLSFDFAIPLSERLSPVIADEKFHYLGEGEGETVECPGTADDPQASPGYLCLYAKEAAQLSLFSPGTRSFPSGAVLTFVQEGAGSYGLGSWAVTAP